MSRGEAGRRLSYWRLALAVIILAGITTGSVLAMQQLHAVRQAGSRQPWFAAYVDVTATPIFSFQKMGASKNKDAVLSFIVSLASDSCTPAWGSAYTLNQANAALSLDTRIARLQQQGGSIAISFGGRDHQELAVGCSDQDKLRSAYEDVIKRYNVDTIDLDLEGDTLSNAEAGTRRAQVIAKLQADRRAKGKKLAVWVTLPVAPQGLTEPGTNMVATLLKEKVDLAGVNVMTMDYGSSLTADKTMLSASKEALTETHRQLDILYRQAGIELSSLSLWRKLGATPMIGQNDDKDEVFTLADATALNEFAHTRGVGRMSMWSANRDLTCGSNYTTLKIPSNSCSGVDQGSQTFASVLSRGFNGSITLSADLVTKADAIDSQAEKPDDPAISPYQIWSANGAYLQGTKVVWHHNVYQAKWWTQGDTPDNPVLQVWQTPWELIGPVLPNEKPIPQPTLPPGTFPDWSGEAVYNTGQRVLFNEVPYQAKWWNQGSSPAAASSNPNGSPWVPLTQAQINEVEAGLNK